MGQSGVRSVCARVHIVHICAYLHSCAYVCIYVENVHMCDKMLKCAHLCIFRLVCACAGQICCLMVAHDSNCIVFSNTVQFAICAFLFTWNSYCILYFVFFPTRISGGTGIRGIITPVYRKTVCTVTFSCKIERPLFCIVYRNATLKCAFVLTQLHISTLQLTLFKFSLDDRVADLQLCFLYINLSNRNLIKEKNSELYLTSHDASG